MVTANTAWQGRGNLESLVSELQRQRESRMDFVADSRSLRISSDGNILRIAPQDKMAEEWLPVDGLEITSGALAQFGGRSSPNVPVKFLRELTEAQPHVAAGLLTDLMHAAKNRNLVRCLDGKCRAFLSNSYRMLDNYDLAFAALDVVRQSGGEIVEATLSDTNMRLKFTTRKLWDTVNEKQHQGIGNKSWIESIGVRGFNSEGELPGGPGTVFPFACVSNSETGDGGLSVRLGLLRGACMNGLIVEDVAREIHLGRKLELGVYSEETITADTKATMLKCRDAIRLAFEEDRFKAIVAKANNAASDVILAPSSAVANIVEAGGLTESDQENILAYFLRDYDQTRYGLAQAVSRFSQDVSDPEVAANAESLAGRIIKESSLVAV